MPRPINRSHLYQLATDHPYASYTELARLMGCAQATVSRIMRYEFKIERRPHIVVIADFEDLRRAASFPRMQFLASAWFCDWPYGLRVRDDSGEVFVVRGFLRAYRWRQRLVGAREYIEPVNGDGKGRRVTR